MQSSARHKQFAGLELLRFMAISLIVIYHFFYWQWSKGEQLRKIFPAWHGQTGALHFGWVGNEVIFAISGFIISYSAYGSTTLDFFRSRALRLIPGDWICATLSFLAIATVLRAHSDKTVVDYVCSLIFDPFKAIDNVYWILSVEIAFYCLVGCLIGLKRLALLEAVMLVIAAFGGMFWIAALTLVSLLEHSTGPLGSLHSLVVHAEGNRILQMLLVQHGAFFALGVVFQRSLVDGLKPWRRWAFALLPIVCFMEIAGENSIIERGAGIKLSAFPAELTWLSAMIFLAVTIVYNDKIVARLPLVRRVIGFLSRSTYPLYLLHSTVILSVVVLMAPRIGIYSIDIGLAMAYLAAWLIEGGIETLLRTPLKKTPWATEW